MKKKKKKIKGGKWKKFLALLLFMIVLCNFSNVARLFYPAKYMDHILIYAEKYEVDPYLIMAVIKAESNFNQEAVSEKSASGLMQITEDTALWLADRLGMDAFLYKNIKEPSINIEMGCYYIAYLLDLYDGNLENALAAYNAGPGNVNSWLQDKKYSKDGENLSVIPFPETDRYINQVKANINAYEFLYEIKA